MLTLRSRPPLSTLVAAYPKAPGWTQLRASEWRTPQLFGSAGRLPVFALLACRAPSIPSCLQPGIRHVNVPQHYEPPRQSSRRVCSIGWSVRAFLDSPAQTLTGVEPTAL